MSGKVYGECKSGKSSMPNAADYHQEIHKNEEDNIALKSYRSRHKHGNHGREYEDEMVKYMSNLPGYLQRGREESREKVLNVGVLDWNRLEQWKNSRKHATPRNRRSSSSNNDSSSVSKDGVSGHPSKDQGTILRQSLKSHFMASSIQDHSQAVKSSRRSIGHCQEFRGSIGNIDTKDHPNRRLKEFNREYLDPHIDKESGIIRNEKLHKAASSAMLEMRSRDDGMRKRVEKFNEPNIDNVVQSMLRKREPFVHNLPTKSEDHSLSFLAQKSEDHTRLSFSEQPKEFFRKELNHDISHSGSLPDELSCNDSQDKGSACSSTDMESFKLPASTFSSPASTPSSPSSVRVDISPPKSRKAEEMKQTVAKISSANVPLHEVDQKVTSEKSRSSSPFRQLRRGSACKETGHVPHQNCITAAEYSSDNVRGCENLNISGNHKPGDAGRSRTSPLRRLLDPLLKPKTAKFSHALDSSLKDSLSTNKNYRSANARFSTLHPIKEVDRDHKAGCSAVKTVDSSRDMKHTPSMTHALLRIAVKNGLPLFTFAVNQIDGSILAAKVKNLGGGSGKDECNRIYTFLTFSEVKKKNGSWMSKAGRSKEPDYVPQVVAQMKASDLYYCDLTGQNCMDSSTMKEFVLFSVKLGQGDAQDADYQPNDELAAIAVKIPKAISLINNQHQSSCHIDTHDAVHATVVLPGGVHSFPSKGGPSSLLERWKSGGSCDCGGWDLACKLKILANENQASQKPRSSKPYFADYQFDLFVQVYFVRETHFAYDITYY